ncbi:hypothetical protein [Oceanobacillus indicireducens]|uniref:Prophage pi2 protein 38 n=1 Tax=Oceanobacillus indicireducens TaxID=1004261 RepID=A0A918D5F9_9BACI|nr:hypothetical protein [Oceanobacillus indicireducens]GGN66757.1 hypothetical protein GCM10007971_37050 [Oceanobacillus indicireducens]
MTLIELKKLLDATGYPVAYSHFNKTTETPFITYLVTYSPHFHADNKTYHKIDSVDIELYTDKKDLQAEQVLEDLLDENELPYDSYEEYIETEKVLKKTYEVRLL